MAGVCQLKIDETAEELKNLLGRQKTVSGFERVQALYLFKIGQVRTVKDLAVMMGKHRITVQRWLQKYRQGGMPALLGEDRKSPGRKPTIPASALERLQQRLQSSARFKSYKEIQSWLKQECGIEASYPVVYKTVRYLLKSFKSSAPLTAHRKIR